ncbi:MAG: CocE/NonD family hydrolase [Stenotrophobium sp.]
MSVTCATPLPPTAINSSITDNIPSDYDSTASPTPAATTTINFTVLLPSRCPGDRFPLILQSHGYGGSRITSIGPNGSFNYTEDFFDGLNTLVQALPYHGYVVISYDERGHGTASPGTAPNNARIIDPSAETQDAINLLDWAWCHSNAALNAGDSVCTTAQTNATKAAGGTPPAYVQSFVQQEDAATGIPRDIRVGTIGYSYGGGFQLALAQLDSRVDTIIPNGTWNNLVYSLLPGDSLKLGFNSLLCVLATEGNVNNTPLVTTLCGLILGTTTSSSTSPLYPTSQYLRTRADLVNASLNSNTPPTSKTRGANDHEEILDLFYSHGSQFFESPTRDGKALEAQDNPGYISPALSTITGIPTSSGLAFPPPASRRAIPALFLQGNRDTLFNITDAYFNYRYYSTASGSPDVRILTNEGGHMNPLAGQTQGTANCGGVVSDDVVLAWFDEKLKGIPPAANTDIPSSPGVAANIAIPKVCISVTPTPTPSSAPANPQNTVGAPANNMLASVLLDHMPVGALSGTGTINATKPSISAAVAYTTTGGAATYSPSRGVPVFVPVVTIPGNVTNAVLAGIPTIGRVSVTTVPGITGSTAAPGTAVTPVAYIGVGIQRGTASPYLVDDQATPFASLPPDPGTTDCTSSSPGAPGLPTDHCHNRGTNNDSDADSAPSHNVLLPGLGEVLQAGDVVGLMIYENQIQYVPAQFAAGNTTQVIAGVANPYNVTLTNVSLPILIPSYPTMPKADPNYPGFPNSAVSCGAGYSAPPLCP